MHDPKADSQAALERMQQAIVRLKEHVHGCSRGQFLNDRLLSDAVLMQFLVIGEEVRRVEPELLERHPYPWHQVRAFRNLIAHDYYTNSTCNFTRSTCSFSASLPRRDRLVAQATQRSLRIVLRKNSCASLDDLACRNGITA